MNRISALILGLGIMTGLLGMGVVLGNSALQYKAYERTVRVKGLSEREMPADIVIWPIKYVAADNDLTKLYQRMETSGAEVRRFLEGHGIDADEITVSPPSITDKVAQSYGGPVGLRYSASQTVTVYSERIDTVRSIMAKTADLGKNDIVISGDEYGNATEYIFTRLNELKPEMIEEATVKAREVAEEFATDSGSRLGKIKSASQGQFSISERDRNNPHIKKIRVVSTVEYYLKD